MFKNHRVAAAVKKAFYTHTAYGGYVIGEACEPFEYPLKWPPKRRIKDARPRRQAKK